MELPDRCFRRTIRTRSTPAATCFSSRLNEGQSWEIISPDLTRNDKSKQGSSGGPITKDNTSVEYYGTIFTVMESPVQAGMIWAGSRRRPGSRHARWRQELDERHAAERHHAGMDSDQLDRCFAARCRHGLRRGDDVQVGRQQTVSLQDQRLRQDLEEDHQRNSRRRVHARDSRGPEQARFALRRNRNGNVRFVR